MTVAVAKLHGKGIVLPARGEDWHCPAEWDDLFSAPSADVGRLETGMRTEPYIPRFMPSEGEAALFVRNARPSEEVAAMMPDIPPGTAGYHVRRLAPGSSVSDAFDPPPGSFMATDWKAQRDLCRKKGGVITVNAPGMETDVPAGGRRRIDCLSAAADWFCLLKCRTVFSVGNPWEFTTFLWLLGQYAKTRRDFDVRNLVV